ncbi:hypothetical protein [Cognaticolwellia mytili]|uniref:hypothetical protein n=1 Tax=Cognaticolwellia mytili TaxID=1888913 RepID=UPI000A16FCDE|nr:hypothetical protein [Cognaticolwellia mytili]
MITVKTQSLSVNGIVRRRYEVTLTDLLGDEHTEILGIFNHEESNSGSLVEQAHLAFKKLEEIEEYKESIRQKVNPFLDESKWNTRSELLRAVLDDALSLPATDALVYNGLPFLSLVSDAELMTIYQQDQAWVDATMLKARNLLKAKDNFDNYEPAIS